MSKWYMPKLEDIDLAENGKVLNIWLDSDDAGNIWVELKVEDLKTILSKSN